MKAFLMYAGRDFDLEGELPANAAALTVDLALDTLFDAMADGELIARGESVPACDQSSPLRAPVSAPDEW